MTKRAALHCLSVPTPILKRGFWLYVWRVGLPVVGCSHFVGMTGDTGAARAQSAANHVAAHLGFSLFASALRKSMQRKQHSRLEDCRSLDFFAFGPVYPDGVSTDYPTMRGNVTALARHLWHRMEASGYDMLNTPVQTTATLDVNRWNDVCAAFKRHFAELH
jgi:hypothetical protein